MAILEDTRRIDMSQREIAVVVAKAIAKTGLPVPHPEIRNDVNYIQIDPIIIEKRVTDPKLGVRLMFRTADRMEVVFNVNVEEFAAGPTAYIQELMTHLHPMIRNCKKMARNKRLMDSMIYDVLTQETAANG